MPTTTTTTTTTTTVDGVTTTTTATTTATVATPPVAASPPFGALTATPNQRRMKVPHYALVNRGRHPALTNSCSSASLVPNLDGQNITYEDPASLPFPLPASLEDVTAEWMTQLLQYRGMIPADVTVTSIEKKGVGMTAGYFSSIAKVKITLSSAVPGVPGNYVAKAWPQLELLPQEAIGNMFVFIRLPTTPQMHNRLGCRRHQRRPVHAANIGTGAAVDRFVNDIKGYSEFSAAEWYPRPDVFLATYDVSKNLYALVMADADDTGAGKSARCLSLCAAGAWRCSYLACNMRRYWLLLTAPPAPLSSFTPPFLGCCCCCCCCCCY
jgi:hypothetical protein